MVGKMKQVPLDIREAHLSRLVVEHIDEVRTVKHTLSVVQMDNNGEISITPFRGETPCTVYHDNPLHVFRARGILYE